MRDSRDGGERTTSKPMNLTHSRIPELAMSKHEQRAPRPSQLKLTVKRKRLSFPNGANRRASCAKKASTTANSANRRASAVAPPTAIVTSAEMALGLRQTSHSSGAALPPPFFFCGCGAIFSTPPYPTNMSN